MSSYAVVMCKKNTKAMFVELSAKDISEFKKYMKVYIRRGHIVNYLTFVILIGVLISAIWIVWIQNEMNILARLSLILIITIPSAIYIYIQIIQGRFILAANEEGILYRSKLSIFQYIFINWVYIDTIRYVYLDGNYAKPISGKALYETSDDGGELEIFTNIDNCINCPAPPAHGYLCTVNNRYVLSFAPGSGKFSTSQISDLIKLHEESKQNT